MLTGWPAAERSAPSSLPVTVGPRMSIEHIRNIAIIAHVDHGKTTMVDRLLQFAGSVASHREMDDRVMDSNDLEKERGITITAKSTTVRWKDDAGETWTINIVDTPGHADFGGEVERVLRMVDSVILIVDSFEGPMPQTRFVLRKSLALGLRPIVVINKIDRPEARPDAVLDMVFDLFVALEATDEQLDFPVLYASGRNGYAKWELEHESDDMQPLFEAVLKHVPVPQADPSAPLRAQVATLAWDNFVGRMGVARIYDGDIKVNQTVNILSPGKAPRQGRISKLYRFNGIERVSTDSASAGEIVTFAGLDDLLPGDTVAALTVTEGMPAIDVDEPTITMRFAVNNSPFAGLDGKYVTSRQIRDRLERELEQDVSLRLEDGPTGDSFTVSGRGELHLSVLIEKMRREGYEMGVSQPQVIMRTDEDGNKTEPWEHVMVECGEDYAGTVIAKLNERKGQMEGMSQAGEGMTRLEYLVPSRGLIGFRNEFMTDTRGTGVMHSVFDHYGPFMGAMARRANGALIALEAGDTTAYSLYTLQDRGIMFLGNAEAIYGGQVIGQHARENDLVVNPCKKKAVNNMRTTGADEKLVLSPPRIFTLETALEWINEDELVEVTPKSIRIRKAELDHNKRKRA